MLDAAGRGGVRDEAVRLPAHAEFGHRAKVALDLPGLPGLPGLTEPGMSERTIDAARPVTSPAKEDS